MKNSKLYELPSEGFVCLPTVLRVLDIGKTTWWCGIPSRSGATETSLSGAAADLVEPEKPDLGAGIDGGQRRSIHPPAAGNAAQSENVEEKPAERNQIGVADHEQNRTGNNRVELSGTAGRGSEGSPPDAGREDQEHRGAGGGLRAAVDAAVRICSEFAAACRRLEQYVIERRKTVERERERPPRGMSR